MPKFFYGKDKWGMPYGGLTGTEPDVQPIESTVASWLLRMRAATDQWPSHFAVREHLESKEQRALYQLTTRGWVNLITDERAIVRYVIPEAEHADARQRKPSESLHWRKITEALEVTPITPLSAGARAILIFLIEHKNEENRVRMSTREIGKEMNIDSSNVYDRLMELVKRGMITKVVPIGSRTATYTICEEQVQEYAGVKA